MDWHPVAEWRCGLLSPSRWWTGTERGVSNTMGLASWLNRSDPLPCLRVSHLSRTLSVTGKTTSWFSLSDKRPSLGLATQPCEIAHLRNRLQIVRDGAARTPPEPVRLEGPSDCRRPSGQALQVQIERGFYDGFGISGEASPLHQGLLKGRAHVAHRLCGASQGLEEA